MNEQALLGPTAWGVACGAARLKSVAEDFQVDEVMDIPFSGEGEHLWLWLEKRLLNTEEVALRLAKAAGVPLKQISYAGLKDRHALTRQWFSIHLPGKTADLSGLECAQLRLLRTERHSRKLQRGAHAANGFLIRLTDLRADHAELEARLQCIAQQGVPNYFGVQRFGDQGRNLQHAQHYAQLAELPQKRNLRSRLLSVARSHLFNRILAQRVADATWQTALVGDALSFTQSRSFFIATEQDTQDPRLAQLDLHPTGALWGEGELPTQGVMREMELGLAEQVQPLPTWLEQAGLRQERRILRLPVSDLQWQFPAQDCLELQFTLPTGCFATAVVRELVDVLPEEGVEQTCEY